MSKIDSLKSILVLGAVLTQTSRTADGKESDNGLTGKDLLVVRVEEKRVGLMRCEPKGIAETGIIDLELTDPDSFANVTDNSFELKIVRDVEKETKRTFISHFKVKAPSKKVQQAAELIVQEREAEEQAEPAAEAAAQDETDPEGLETPTQKASTRKK